MKIGQIIKERYEIVEILGEGGMAFVYKARDKQLQRDVAIKTLKPNYVNQEKFVDRFRREAQTAANLNHPNIVQIFDWGIEDEPYFVMEYIEGNTLTSIISGNRTVGLNDILYIGSQVANGLKEAHKRGLVHRDIKPGNIMITPDGKVKVTDFGIVSLQNEESDITKTGAVLGTASYINAILKLLEKRPSDRFKSAEDLRALLLQQRKQIQINQTQENLVDLTNPKIKFRFTLPALIISVALVFGTVWALSNVFDGLPVDGGAPTLVEIPDLTGSEQAQALNDLQSLGFIVGIENAADSSVPAGFVITTQPPANTITNPDTLVTIIVSVGPEAFPIPYVVDLEVARGVYVIKESGFQVGQQLEINDDNIPRGFIISQNPIAGTKMSPDSTVDLVISAGPSLIEISDLSRKSIVDAIQILETLGFEYEFIEEYSEDVSVGLVSHTIPRAGEQVTIDQVIQVIVSIGLKVEVPNLIGFTYQEASNILQEIGLLPSASGDTGGRVSEQNPREGEFIDPEGFVELSFGS